MIHHIKKITSHKHTQTLFVLFVLAGLIYFFLNYKKSEAADTSPYIYDVHLESNNASSTLATPVDTITYSFKLKNVLQKSRISYVSIRNSLFYSGVGVNCTYLNASGTVSVLQDTEILPSASTPDLSCFVSDTAPRQDVINTIYSTQVDTSVQVQVDPDVTSSPQVEIGTDDGSGVNYLRTSTTSSNFFVDTVHIESAYLTDLTLATPTKMITLTYTMPEPVQVDGGVENQVVTILGRTAEFLCEQPYVTPAFMDLFIDTAYAQVNPGKVTCVATTTVTDSDIDNNISGYVVPFSIENKFYKNLEEEISGPALFNYNISTTTDSSFVRILKDAPVIMSPVASNTDTYVAGIVSTGLISLTPTTVIPQNNTLENTTQKAKDIITPEIKVNKEETIKEVLGLNPENTNLTYAQIEIINKNKRRVLGADGLAKTGSNSKDSILLGFSLFTLAAISINYIHRKSEKNI